MTTKIAKPKKQKKASPAGPDLKGPPETPPGMGATQKIPVDDIRIPNGNRHEIDNTKLLELAQSMKTRGQINPIVVQISDGKKPYELIAGERRVRAAQWNGWDEIEARILMNVSPEEAKAIRLTENLQREDLTPWEEAEHLAGLRELNPDAPIEELAAKVGRGPQWVAQRLAVGKLLPSLRDLVIEQDWPLSHLPLLARVPFEAQIGLFEAIKDEQKDGWDWRDNGEDRDTPPVPTLRDLERFLDDRSRLMTAAPWKMDDATLDAKAGACAFCPKRSSAQALLFPDLADGKDDRCLDADCWGRKQKALVAVNLTKLTEEGKEPILLSGTYGSRHDEDNEELRKLIGADVEIKDQHHYRECKKKDPGAKPAIIATGDKAGTIKYVQSSAVANSMRDPVKSKKIDQETGKAKPPTTKERLATLKAKRQCRAVELWSERLEKLKPATLEWLYRLIVVFGTDSHADYRDDESWKAVEKGKYAIEDAWEQLFPIFEKRLNRFGPIEENAEDLWAEASKQADSLGLNDDWEKCWKDAVAEVKFPKTLAKEGIVDEDAAA